MSTPNEPQDALGFGGLDPAKLRGIGTRNRADTLEYLEEWVPKLEAGTAATTGVPYLQGVLWAAHEQGALSREECLAWEDRLRAMPNFHAPRDLQEHLRRKDESEEQP